MDDEDVLVQALCENLVANDPAFMKARISPRWSDENMDRVADAMKRNTTIEWIHIHDGEMSLRAELALFSGVLAHPKVNKLSFFDTVLEDLGNVVRMFRNSDRLAHLSFQFCHFNDDCLDSISSLVEGDFLESLYVEDCATPNEYSFYDATNERLAEALARNRTLKKLGIEVGYHEYGDGISMRTLVPSLCSLLQGNQVLSKLSLGMHERDERLVENGSEMISRISQAATGHPTLQHLALRIETDLSEESAEAIGGMLRSLPTLRELSLCDASIEPAALRHLTGILQDMDGTLAKLDLSRELTESESDEFGSSLGEFLISNPNLRSLNLCRRRIDNSDACAIAEGLKQNNKLEAIDLLTNEIGDEGTTAIAGALYSNRSIKSIKLAVIGGATVETETVVLKAVEQNTTLEHFVLYGISKEAIERVNHLLALNRGGRRLLGSQSEVPLNYWPRILANASDNANVLYFFLKEKHDTLIPRADARPATRKRKRNEGEE